MFQKRLLAGILVLGLHVSGCIGGLISIPAAFAEQITAVEHTEGVLMTPAVFLCQEEPDGEQMAENSGCESGTECMTQSEQHVTDRSVSLHSRADPQQPAEIQFVRVHHTDQSHAYQARSGPLIALLELPLHPFVQRE